MSTHHKKDWEKFRSKHDIEKEVQDDTLSESSATLNEPEEEAFDHETALLTHPSYLKQREELQAAEQREEEARKELIHLKAEWANYQKRSNKEKEDAYKYANEDLLKAMLPILDGINQAEQLAQQNQDVSMSEGLELIQKMLGDVFGKFHVEEICPPVGTPFNPQIHEAMSLQETSEAPNNSIIAVFQKGYQLNGRVMRAARVAVAKNKNEGMG